MAALILPSRRVVQPQGPVEVDWANPLSRGLIFLHSAASFGVNLVDGKRPIVQSGTVGTDTSANGKSVALTSATLEWDVAPGFPDCTIFSLSDGYSNTDNPRVGLFPASANEGDFLSYESGALKAFSIGGGSFPNASFTTSALNAGRVAIAGVYSSTASRKIYLDGIERASNTGVAANASTFSRAAFSYRGNGTPVAQSFTKKHAVAGIWGRAFTQAELVELYVNPWQLFRPIQRRIWVPVAGGGGASQSIAFTLEDVTASVSQTLQHAQSLSATLDGITVAASQTLSHSQALAATLDDVSVSIAQTLGNANSQAIAFTLDGVTVAAAQTLSHSQSVDATLDGVTFAASQTLSHSQALAATLDGITVAINQSAAPSSKEQSLAVVLDGIQVAIAQEGPASLIDTHDGFWAKEWARIRAREKRKYQAEVQERVEEIQDEIAEVEQQIVEVKQAPKPKKATPARDFYAEQARIVEHLIARRNQLIEEEDEELLLLL